MESATKIRVAIVGASGRMGKELLAAVTGPGSKFELARATVKPESSLLGRSLSEKEGGSQIQFSDSLAPVDFDVVIDFTVPDYSMQVCRLCAEHKVPTVIGTTGFNEDQLTELGSLASQVPILLAPNMSIGVNLMFHLLEQITSAIGQEADIEIQETHHRNKLDSPSGTALRMGEIIAHALGQNLSDVAVYGRQGMGEVRACDTIGFSSIRAGDVIGDHTATFATMGERLEITHKASSREIYAAGALRAANWVVGREPNLYSMQDVLGLTGNRPVL